MPTLVQLEATAADVIGILKGISEYEDAKIAVIGGLAVWKYDPEGRTTEDVDFIVNIGNAPAGVKQRLLAIPNSPCIQRAQFFYYQTQDKTLIQVDITPENQSPYMPAAATKLKDLPAGTVPYISVIDLIVFKISSCGLRAQIDKKRIDALDARSITQKATPSGPLHLTSAQQAIVKPCIADVVAYGDMPEAWWKRRLGLPADG